MEAETQRILTILSKADQPSLCSVSLNNLFISWRYVSLACKTDPHSALKFLESSINLNATVLCRFNLCEN